ncbi:hypothetical protein ANACOL_00749 [Anaerotruncus colihominis DSM 17241]|uniref:Uncharacterized protein n=1 Tax=Anaerotruncus colihominis DSM 17241 TaxID=445972 RepID=B0P7L4_9FIRM|nr:hypothetical protein ANACOL_00749 [Anaerotruncus colihominis DSM 17241]
MISGQVRFGAVRPFLHEKWQEQENFSGGSRNVSYIDENK